MTETQTLAIMAAILRAGEYASPDEHEISNDDAVIKEAVRLLKQARDYSTDG